MASETDTTANIYTCSLFFFLLFFFIIIILQNIIKIQNNSDNFRYKNTTDMPGSRTSKDDEKDFIMV